MPNPGSHKYDIKRTRLRAGYERGGVPDEHADQAANEQLQREHPPQRVGDPGRAAGPLGGGGSRGNPSLDEPRSLPDNVLEVRSAAFSDHTLIPNRYSRDGGNVSPPLQWSAPPAGTAEFVVLCEDPDAPGGTFTHWVVTGIPPDVTGIAEGGLPYGALFGRNDFGETGWGGPWPPVGDEPHRYFFRVYAVDRPLGLGESASAEDVRTALEGHELAGGTLVGLFGR
jgi:Raf kinase inhibitor-like YbhB/YbcL family protein